MSGIYTMAAMAVVSAGVGVASYEEQKSVADQQMGMAGTVFGEQQSYAEQLKALIANPSSVTSLPGYKFNLAQGEQAVSRGFGPTAGSGAEGIALTQYGQNYATSAYDSQVKLLSSLAGLSSSVNPSTAGGVASGASAEGFNEMGKILASLGYLGKTGMPGSGDANPPGTSSSSYSGGVAPGGYLINTPGSVPG